MAKATLIFLCFAAVFSAANCRTVRPEPFYFQLENGTIVAEDLSSPSIRPRSFNSDSVTLYLYTKQTGGDNPCSFKTSENSCANWQNCGFDPKKNTVVLVHGYNGRYDGEAMVVIKDAYVAKKDVNLIIVDWHPVSFPYLVAVSSVKSVGQTAAKAVQFLHENCGACPRKTECVGHSLGAHVCGLLSAALPKRCPRIVGLDPANPIIGLYSDDNRLDKSDADFLQVLHTSRILGDTRAFGDLDLYPNGAHNQYGCDPLALGQLLAGGCDHMKACYLHADSIYHPNSFKTNLTCSSAASALAGNCQPGPVTAYLGEPNNGVNQGIFYIYTDAIYEKIAAEADS